MAATFTVRGRLLVLGILERIRFCESWRGNTRVCWWLLKVWIVDGGRYGVHVVVLSPIESEVPFGFSEMWFEAGTLVPGNKPLHYAH